MINNIIMDAPPLKVDEVKVKNAFLCLSSAKVHSDREH